MTTPSSDRQRPLDRFAVIRTRHLEDLRQIYASIYASPRIEIEGDSGDFSASLNNRELKDIGLSYASYNSTLRMTFPYPKSFMQFFLLRGNGEATAEHAVVPMRAGSIGVIAPAECHVLRIGGNYERLGLALKPDALTKKLSAMIGAPIGHPLRMDSAQDATSPAQQGLRRLAFYLAEQLSADDSLLPDVALAELEQALMTAFLCANRHNYSHLLERKPPGAAPWQVRRVEEFIEANWNRPIRMEDLAAVTGASARSIFRAFRQSRGYSPMMFAKQVRLRRAQQMLRASDASSSVTDIAMACGFGNLGRFSKDYRAAIGESPSQTLNRAKAIGLSDH
jgi:AraC-like DNA-binding protein